MVAAFDVTTKCIAFLGAAMLVVALGLALTPIGIYSARCVVFGGGMLVLAAWRHYYME